MYLILQDLLVPFVVAAMEEAGLMEATVNAESVITQCREDREGSTIFLQVCIFTEPFLIKELHFESPCKVILSFSSVLHQIWQIEFAFWMVSTT